MLPPASSAGKEHSMTVPISWTLDALVEAFEQHQRHVRGLRDETFHGYVGFVRPLIREALGADPIDVRRLGPSDGCGIVGDRKSTRLNSSHLVISYAVFCLKKKKKY